MNALEGKRYAADVRARAVRLVVREGWSSADAALSVGCSKRSVQLWVRKSRRGRVPGALKTRTAPGAAPKLDRGRRRRLLKLLSAGPEAAGFEGQLWTGARVTELIRREFGVQYHPRYVPTLLKTLGWSVQKPKRRPLERNEEMIAAWKSERWPRIKKKPAASAPRSSSSTKRGS